MDSATTIGTVYPHLTSYEIDQLNQQYRNRPAEELLTWAITYFDHHLVLTCSFSGPSGMVLLDMTARLAPETSIIFLDTDLLFPETYALVEAVAQRYGVTIQQQHPALSLAEQEHNEGPALYTRDPNRCCHIRKVLPLEEALRPYRAWLSGIRRDQATTRATTDLLQWSARYNLLKISPLAYWSERHVWAYIHTHHIPYNPLLDQGFPSLGCVPCTRRANADDPRSGRWHGFTKTECGIHI